MDSHRDLVSWQRGMQLVTRIYEATRGFPADERFGLTNQLRRAAVSVPSNIAEGKGRQSRKDYVHFLYQARGSLLEVETQLEIALNLGYLARDQFEQLFQDAGGVGRVLNGLIKSMNKREAGADQMDASSR